MEFLFVSEKTESIQLVQTFPEIPSSAIKSLSLFKHVPRSPTSETDGELYTHLQKFITKQDNIAATHMLAYQLDRKEFELEEVIKTLRKAKDREEDKGLFSSSEKSAKNNAPNFAEIYYPLVIQYYFWIDDMNLLKEEL
ncbi:hypothetical protein CIHG_02048 [Coccidioides immitis H538.4]|uniref:Uncharacterized protein n=1 Tax=Coccidioides immitis H538.4 TaxID=396776 RepID=A0A0J8RHA9_COCIT|nr:hypothetical protein CIHG_02048 [Coccidioides immitis H538.4]